MRARQLELTSGWTARPWTARFVLLAIAVARVGLALFVAAGLAHAFERPSGVLASLLVWAGVTAVALTVLEATDLLSRRFLPLVVLLRLNLAFPGVAPSRFGMALRKGSPGRLDRQLAAVRRTGLGEQPDEAAHTLLRLIVSLTHHDRLTRGHSERVRAYTELIAEELALSSSERERLRWAGLLHDVGKVLVPTDVLNKRGPLDPLEWELVRRHPLDGLALAQPLEPWLGPALLAISDHHERWEGGGYPTGIAGNDISLAGRIVAVADAFDVMTSARSYKAPVSIDEARAELVACAGTQFDPEVVRAFLAIDIPRLRAVAGPLTTLLTGLGLQVRWTSTPATSAVAAATIAVTGMLLPWPDAWTFAPDASGPAAASSPAPGGRSPSAVQGTVEVRTPADDPTSATTETASDTLRSSPDRADRQGPTTPPARAPEADTPDGDGDDGDPRPPGSPRPPSGGPDPDAGPPPATPPGSDGTRIIIDPSTAGVDLDPPGGTAPPVNLVEAPGAGAAVCGATGVCDPIEVRLPLG